MKRALAVLLILGMISAFTPINAIAVDTTKQNLKSSTVLPDGVIDVYQSEESIITVALTPLGEIFEINYIDTTDLGTLYHFTFEEGSIAIVPPSNNWDSLYAYCVQTAEEAMVVEYSAAIHPASETATNRTPRSSAGADLLEDLGNLHDRSEEHDVEVDSMTYNGYDMYVQQYMYFYIEEAGELEWESDVADVLTLASFIAMFTPYAAAAKTIGTFATIFGVAALAYSEVPSSGSFDEYDCIVQIYRDTYVENSAIPYESTYHYITYKGYDDNDHNSGTRAAVVQESAEHYYSESASYFNDCVSQMLNAYRAYI